jgi:Holliday junction resolvase
MTQTHYTTGVAHEHRTRNRFIAHGWIVIRAAGSKGPFDLLAAKHRQRVIISCKRNRQAVGPTEWHALWNAAQIVDATPLIADMSGPRNALRLWQLVGDRNPHTRIDTYLEPWHLIPTEPASNTAP